MQKTPEHLTKEFQIAPGEGQGRALPRVLLAYSGPNKSRFLSVAFSGMMAGALPEYGQKRTWRRDVTQEHLAESLRVSRETYTRWMSEVATPDDSWDVDRRLGQRDRARTSHQLRGHRLHVEERPAREHVATLISRRRRFMRPNVYAPLLPESGRNEKHWYPPSLADLARDDRTAHLFRSAADGENGYRGFKHIPRWVYSERLPLSSTARLVMTYYIMVGLLKTGVVRPRQSTVAGALGISVRSVYNANCALAALSLIRVAHPKPQINSDGEFTRGPQIIVYLPIRQLTEEEAEYERKRLQFALFASRDVAGPDWMLSRMKELHAALLASWSGKEHCLSAFWNHLRRQAIAEGIRRDVINRLLPSPPE